MTTGPISRPNGELTLDWQHTDGLAWTRLQDAYDPNEAVTKLALLVWDPVGLAWVKMTQPGGAGGGGGGPATIADGADVTQGAKADAAWDGLAASVSVVGILKRLGALLAGTLTVGLPTGASTAAKQDTGNTSVASIDTKTPALGQALAASSVPVVLPSAQVTTLTPPAAITGFAIEAGHLATIDTSTAAAKTDLDTISTNSGLQATAAKQDAALTALTTLDADLKASIGSPAVGPPSAFTEMDRLYQLGLKLDKQQTTLQGILGALAKSPAPTAKATLLHR